MISFLLEIPTCLSHGVRCKQTDMQSAKDMANISKKVGGYGYGRVLWEHFLLLFHLKGILTNGRGKVVAIYVFFYWVAFFAKKISAGQIF